MRKKIIIIMVMILVIDIKISLGGFIANDGCYSIDILVTGAGGYCPEGEPKESYNIGVFVVPGGEEFICKCSWGVCDNIVLTVNCTEEKGIEKKYYVCPGVYDVYFYLMRVSCGPAGCFQDCYSLIEKRSVLVRKRNVVLSIKTDSNIWFEGERHKVEAEVYLEGGGCEEVVNYISDYIKWEAIQGEKKVSLGMGREAKGFLDGFKEGYVTIKAWVEKEAYPVSSVTGCKLYGESKKKIFLAKRNQKEEIDAPANDHDNEECDSQATEFPINIRTGEKYGRYIDIDIRNEGYNLRFERILDTRELSKKSGYKSGIGEIGRGWRTNYDYKLEKEQKFYREYYSSYGVSHRIIKEEGLGEGGIEIGTVNRGEEAKEGIEVKGIKIYPLRLLKITTPEGGTYVFRAKFLGEEGGELKYSKVYKIPGKPWEVIEEGEGEGKIYKLIKEEKIYKFDFKGRLKGINDLAGRGVEIIYGEEEVIVRDKYGREIRIEKDENNKITKVTGPEGEYRYVYEEKEGYNYLKEVDRPGLEDAYYEYGGTCWAGYEKKIPYIISKKDYREEGKGKYVIYEYDCEKEKYTGEYIGDENTKVAELRYEGGGVVLRDKRGIRRYYFNGYGKIERIEWGDGEEIRKYDEYGRIKKIIWKNGTEEEYIYEDSGERYKIEVITRWKDIGGGEKEKTEEYEYYKDGRIKRYTIKEGAIKKKEVIYEYEGKRIKRIIEGGRETVYEYYEDGKIKTMQDGERLSKTYYYDGYGNVERIVNNVTGGEEVYEYYNNGITGKIKSYTDENGIKKEYIYDEDFPDKIKEIRIYERGEIKEGIVYEYDKSNTLKRGNIKSIEDNSGVRVYEYYENGMLEREYDRGGGWRRYEYDENLRIKMIEESEGGRRVYTYDEYGRIRSIIDSKGLSRINYYDKMGNRTMEVDREGKITEYRYDGIGRLRKIINARGEEIEYDYDVIGNRTKIKDGKGNETRYEYDIIGRMIKEEYADGSYIRYEYSVGGDMKKREVYNREGELEKRQELKYDGAHRLINDGIYEYRYGDAICSCGERIYEVEDERGVTRYEYDYKGREKKIKYPEGTEVERIKDDIKHKRVIKIDGEEIFEIEEDGEGRSVRVKEKIGGEEKIYEIIRDRMGRIKEVRYPNGERSETEYDSEGRIKRHVNYYKDKVINRYEIKEMDGEGKKVIEETILGEKRYWYDEIYQIIRARYEGGEEFTWKYDEAGNREYSKEEEEKTYIANNLNQYTEVNGKKYRYDGDGNLLSDGEREYEWDIKNRLIKVKRGGKVIEYKYDYKDLRVEKYVDGELDTRYYYDGSILLAEKDKYGRIKKIYINDGEGIIGMVRYVYKEDGSFSHYKRYYYMYDTLGSVSVVTDETGKPEKEYYYTPYGKVINTEYDPVNPLRFIGRYGGYTDDDVDLVYFWHRWYDVDTGRWISRDPIGVMGGVNLYGYVKNNSVNKVDWYGLCPDEPEWQIMPLPEATTEPIKTPPTPEPETPWITRPYPKPTPTFCEMPASVLTSAKSDCPGIGQMFLLCVVTCEWAGGKITRVPWLIILPVKGWEKEICLKYGKPQW